jgi:hypothetical protein
MGFSFILEQPTKVQQFPEFNNSRQKVQWSSK